MIEKYNTVNNENIAPRTVGLIVTDLSKTMAIEKLHKPGGMYYKGIKFKQDLIEL